MNTLICQQPGRFEYKETAFPEVQAGHSLLKIRRIGICGTDLHAFQGTQPYFSYPRILGHELAAEIIATDSPVFEVGEAVTVMPYMHCGRCIACSAGKSNCCENIQVLGVHTDGGMREQLLIPNQYLLKGKGLSLDELALVEPLAIGAHGIRRADIRDGEWVLVIGAGPIGLGLMAFAKIAGAKVIAMDVNEMRLSFCKEKIGIEKLVNPSNGEAIQAIKEITGGEMPTVVIDATGNLAAINDGFRYLAHTGRYVLVGLQKGEISFSHPEFHKREATLMSSRNATKQDFEWVMDCLKSGKISPQHFITHRAKFEEVQSKFADWLDPANGVVKAMVEVN